MYPLISNFILTNISWFKKKTKTANIWEYKVYSNANISIFVCLWKNRISRVRLPPGPIHGPVPTAVPDPVWGGVPFGHVWGIPSSTRGYPQTGLGDTPSPRQDWGYWLPSPKQAQGVLPSLSMDRTSIWFATRWLVRLLWSRKRTYFLF